jgi:hypothetical protein
VDGSSMRLTDPPTQQEIADLNAALRNNIPQAEYMSNKVWFGHWAHYLIGLRRGYQKRFISEAYNEHSSST